MRFVDGPPHSTEKRRRARDLGLPLGRFKPGKWNAITDVEGVLVGHSTIIRGAGPLRRVLGEAGLPAVIFGHAGDGNLHVNPLVDVSRPGWRAEVEAVTYAVAEGVAALGGTMAGEHGDGRLRAPLLETVWGPELVSLFRAVKDAFDPRGILNPGVILPLPGQRPLDGVRY